MTKQNRDNSNHQRTFVQYLLETIWTIGVGVLVTYWLPELAVQKGLRT
jgi:hypothetical protein